jgi:trans-2,3-dihydro-3-hydroxyanthranilate isomerase
VAELRLYHLDVFAERPYQGNPLAVVVGGEDLPSEAMQAIARELHLSETAFVLPAGERDGAVARLRIFTPTVEMPFAGHPSVGSAWLLTRLGRAPAEFAFDVAAGRLAAVVEGAQLQGPAWVRSPRPRPAEVEDPGALTAAVLATAGLAERDLAGPGPELWSTGNEHHLTLLRPGTDLAILRPDLGALAGTLGERGWLVASFDEPGRARVRYFAPGLGVAEDPATGSAAAAFVGYLAARHPEALDGGRLRITQGAELGQPSVLHAAWRDDEAWIGGTCHLLYQAELLTPGERADGPPGGQYHAREGE